MESLINMAYTHMYEHNTYGHAPTYTHKHSHSHPQLSKVLQLKSSYSGTSDIHERAYVFVCMTMMSNTEAYAAAEQ